MNAIPKPSKLDRVRSKIDTSEMPLSKPNPARDADYRGYVRSHPCAIRGRAEHVCEGPVEAAHIRTAGFALKASDYATVPLCVKAHRFAQHNMGWPSFMSTYDFNPWHVAFHLLEAWHRRMTR